MKCIVGRPHTSLPMFQSNYWPDKNEIWYGSCTRELTPNGAAEYPQIGSSKTEDEEICWVGRTDSGWRLCRGQQHHGLSPRSVPVKTAPSDVAFPPRVSVCERSAFCIKEELKLLQQGNFMHSNQHAARDCDDSCKAADRAQERTPAQVLRQFSILQVGRTNCVQILHQTV